MKAITFIGIALIVLGGLALAYGGFTYVTRETVVDIGAVRVEADRERTVPLPPIIGGVALVLGIGLMVVGLRQRSA